MDQLEFIQYSSHKKLVKEILKEYQPKHECIGFMLIGSVARGDAYPESDLDLLFLLENEHSQPFQTEVKGNILIEYKYTNFKQAQVKLEKNPMEIYSYLDGKVIYDKKGQFIELKRIALEKYNSYKISEHQTNAILHWLKSSYHKISAANQEEDHFKASYVINTSTWVMLEGLWAINHQPMPPSGAVWAHINNLKRHPPNLDSLLKTVFVGDVKEQIDSFMIIIEWIMTNLAKCKQ
ncbi:DNA polymerase subunit beta [Bacillus sp. J14TS2]|uniref:nucleotidyltransferase domain-containing protein n=1 Tax=Bacillus sp. J14TS2 TaxID=2807188 RepID=UPI001B1B0F1C|nr:nucleotidyltransferase domain-containing protein [Bacillus sp. J14TS2]GIN72042.1 DNA polymerase subunit beta [Bacillus sp. J14TS2]